LLVQNFNSADGSNVNVTATVADSHRLCFDGLRRRTPGPPPFSSMNSTPAACRAFRAPTETSEMINCLVIRSVMSAKGAY
jgi:hypothetical protein